MEFPTCIDVKKKTFISLLLLLLLLKKPSQAVTHHFILTHTTPVLPPPDAATTAISTHQGGFGAMVAAIWQVIGHIEVVGEALVIVVAILWCPHGICSVFRIRSLSLVLNIS